MHSIALHRVIGVDQSVILGQLSSDSQVILINPHRKLFGTTTQINTGEFLATTLQIWNEDVLGHYSRSMQGPLNAAVHSETIHVSEEGYVALAAPGVSQAGVVIANVGTVREGSGQKYTLDLMSDGLINYTISDKALSQVTGLNDAVLADSISSEAAKPAGVGQVILNANAAGDIISSVETPTVSTARATSSTGEVSSGLKIPTALW